MHMRSIVKAKHGNNHILDFYIRYATLTGSFQFQRGRCLTTNLDVASATSSKRQPVAVLKRELLWQGGIIEIKIPAVCRDGAFEDIKFIQFARFVKGGVVNFFVHNDNPTQHCGKIITASVQVFRKEHADGRSFLYVDLLPTTAQATHRLTVMDAIPGVTSWTPFATVLLTPAPLQGAVVIVGRDE